MAGLTHLRLVLTQPSSSGRGDGEPQALKRRRSKKVKEICIARDEECVLTGNQELHVAHIYPFSAASAQQIKSTLTRLWGADREKAISEKLFPNGTTMSIDVIGNRGKEEGRWTIKVVFYWLKHCSVAKTSNMGKNIWASAREVLLQTADILEAQQPRAFDLRTGAPILNGQIFTIKAAMKDHLPDYDILILQWDIARMASLCGAAESGDDYDKDASDADTYDADAYDADTYDADAYDVDAYDTDDDEKHVEAEMEMTNT
ncbi:predicted protein [Verticillium alfalfae VaMs.102]|uniref:Predicted protein n=1 Tax=Verticillium alfalfae (strain VaMs.102 / ATCC MYA-4576 / FGSC 10136) TaxID=526221 RepID=C9S8M1_VERA1|nr:predicted protein [Verticillium alfalfae VaMs.102]EEY13982.1 predicted protein [Verticillium alfalfae VaMs.102]